MMRCDTCPFTSADPQAIGGHEHHAPPRGWLGHGETHIMRMVSTSESGENRPREGGSTVGAQGARTRRGCETCGHAVLRSHGMQLVMLGYCRGCIDCNATEGEEG